MSQNHLPKYQVRLVVYLDEITEGNKKPKSESIAITVAPLKSFIHLENASRLYEHIRNQNYFTMMIAGADDEGND